MESSGYKYFRLYFLIATVVFFILIIYGVTAKDIIAEGSHILEVYWGVFTFIDLYFIFFVFYFSGNRPQRPGPALGHGFLSRRSAHSG